MAKARTTHCIAHVFHTVASLDCDQKRNSRATARGRQCLSDYGDLHLIIFPSYIPLGRIDFLLLFGGMRAADVFAAGSLNVVF